MKTAISGAIAGALLLAVTIASSQAAGLRVRGEVTSISGSEVSVATTGGQTAKVSLADPYVVLLYRDITLEEIKDGAYVGVPSAPGAAGARRALGVIAFPEAMRGMNEGFGEWDLTAESKMTNATVAKVVSQDDRRVLTVSYGEETQTILVPEGVPVATFAPAEGRKLAVGEKVVIFADEKAGALTGRYVGVHANGGLPPL